MPSQKVMQAVLCATTINSGDTMNASFSWHDKSPSPNESQSMKAKQPLNKRQFCFSCVTPLVRIRHPYHLLITDLWGSGAFSQCSHNETCLEWLTPPTCSTSGWYAFHSRLVFYLTKGSQMLNLCPKLPSSPCLSPTCSSPCGNNSLCKYMCHLDCHAVGSFLTSYS